MIQDEIPISKDECVIFNTLIPEIKHLFDVDIATIGPPQRESADCGPSKQLDERGTPMIWIKLSATSVECLQQAKDHMLRARERGDNSEDGSPPRRAVCTVASTDDEGGCMDGELHNYQTISPLLDLNKCSGSIDSSTGSERRHGRVVSGVMARTLLEDRVNQLYISTQQCSSKATDQHKDEPRADISMANPPPASALSPGIDSNPDSCYDSDASSACSRRNSTPLLEAWGHSDVSRTTSDTLAAEHSEADPVVVKGKTPGTSTENIAQGCEPGIQMSSPRPKHDSTSAKPKPSKDLMSNPEYASKVEFALKLGYSESQIQSALCKVGYKASQNVLLGELVQVSDSPEEDATVDIEGVAVGSFPMDKSISEHRDPTPEEEEGTNDEDDDENNLRPIVIDGSNLAMSHGIKDVFSCRGIKLAVDWFKERGHKEITVFVPTWRKEASRPDTQIADQGILRELEGERTLVFTPARRIPSGKRVVCYDDRYIIKLAAENGGIVVSNDNYRDLIGENTEYKKVIEERLLMYSFVNDKFMPPDDPLGRHGPSLDDFLCKYPKGTKALPPICPYGKKCTYGNKCKYYHPERGSQPLKPVTERLAELAKVKIKEVKEKGHLGQGDKKQRSAAFDSTAGKKALTRTRSVAPMAPKTALTRTKSATPAMMSPSPASQSAHRSAELPPKRTSADTCTFSFPRTDQTDIKISVSTEAESDEYCRYNDKLSELRRKMEQADLDQENSPEDQIKRRHAGASYGAVSVKHKSDPGSKLKPSGHWSLMHENLRATHSDPSRPYQFEHENPITGGHLALAKKLSDEGRDDGQKVTLRGRGLSPNRQSPLSMPSEDNSKTPTATVSFPNPQAVRTKSAPEKQHQKLQRQLSLKGADDPRLLPGSTRYTPMPMIRGEDMSSDPVQTSRGWAGHVHETLDERVSFPGALPRDMASKLEHRQREHLRTDRARSPKPSQIMAPSVSSNVSQEGPHVLASHMQTHHAPVQRMGSAPVMQTGGEAKAHASKAPAYPKMNRQNSTSDPQLNMFHEEPSPVGWPAVMMPGTSHGTDLHHEMLRRNLQGSMMAPHFCTAPNSPLSPHFNSQLKVPFGVGSPTAGLQNFPNPSGFPNMAALTAQQKAVQLPPYPHNHQGVLNLGLRPPTGYYIPSRAESPSQLLLNPSQEMNKLGEHTARGIQSTFPAHPTQISCMESRPGPGSQDLQSCWGAGSLKDPANPRHKLYYHLCNLFKEEDVTRIMMEHPEESDPQKLCKYLI